MKTIITILLILSFNQVFSQNKDLYYSTDRKGIIFGLGCGAGLLSLSHDTETGENSTAFSYSIPNIKVGYMINNRLALYALLPGATYKFEDNPKPVFMNSKKAVRGLNASIQFYRDNIKDFKYHEQGKILSQLSVYEKRLDKLSAVHIK